MKKQITKVIIEPGCISCGTCEVICPGVFEVKTVSQVKTHADINAHQDLIQEASEMCPVSVIKVTMKTEDSEK